MANNLNHNCINFVQYFCGCNNYHFIVTGDNLTAKKARTFIITWLQLEPKWVYVLHYLSFLFLFHCQGQFHNFLSSHLIFRPRPKMLPWPAWQPCGLLQLHLCSEQISFQWRHWCFQSGFSFHPMRWNLPHVALVALLTRAHPQARTRPSFAWFWDLQTWKK